jgi:DNA-directed RNA polymerase subunit RPC12/RpoP
MSSIAIPEDMIYRAKTDSQWLCMMCGNHYSVKEGDVVKCPKCSEKKS